MRIREFLGRLVRAAEGMGFRRWCWAVFLIALAVRTTYIFGRKTYLNIGAAELVQVARVCARTGVLANPFGGETGPTAHVAPLYPVLLSCVYRLFGTGHTAQIAQETITAVSSSATLALLPALAHGLGFRVATGALGGLIGAFLPIRMWVETKGSWEATYAGLACLGLSWLTLLNWQSGRFTPSAAVRLGLGWGFAVLLSPSLLMVIAATVLVGTGLHRSWAFLRFTGTAGVVTLLILTPWTVRNYIQLGGFAFIRSGFALELWTSNNAAAGPTIEDNANSAARHHPASHPGEFAEMKRLGELRYYSSKWQPALTWIRSHPGRFLALSAQRMAYFWVPRANHPAKRLGSALLFAAALWGLAVLFRLHRQAAWLISAVWILYPLIYYLVQADVRYSYPIYWSLLLLAGLALGRLLPSGAPPPLAAPER